MLHDRSYFVYILASDVRGTLYVGVTNDIVRRVGEHREGEGSAFTRRHRVHRLVWYEQHDDVEQAIRREKLIKRWRRDWKMNLIEQANLYWDDLSEEVGSWSV